MNQLLEQRWLAIRVASRYMRDRQDVLDAVQESMLRIALMEDVDWDRIQGLVATVTRNICIDQIRAAARRRQRDESFLRSLDVGGDYVEEICDRAEAKWLVANLSRVGPREQRILHRVADGAQIAQIAEEEGITYKAAHCALSRARKVLTSIWLSSLALWGVARAGVQRDKGTVFAGLVSLGTAAALIAGTPLVNGRPDSGQIREDTSVQPMEAPRGQQPKVLNGTSDRSVERAVRPYRSPAVVRKVRAATEAPSQPHPAPLGESVAACVSNGVVVTVSGVSCVVEQK